MIYVLYKLYILPPNPKPTHSILHFQKTKKPQKTIIQYDL